MLHHKQNHTESNETKVYNWSYFVTHKHIYNVRHKHFLLESSVKL